MNQNLKMHFAKLLIPFFVVGSVWATTQGVQSAKQPQAEVKSYSLGILYTTEGKEGFGSWVKEAHQKYSGGDSCEEVGRLNLNPSFLKKGEIFEVLNRFDELKKTKHKIALGIAVLNRVALFFLFPFTLACGFYLFNNIFLAILCFFFTPFVCWWLNVCFTYVFVYFFGIILGLTLASALGWMVGSILIAIILDYTLTDLQRELVKQYILEYIIRVLIRIFIRK